MSRSLKGNMGFTLLEAAVSLLVTSLIFLVLQQLLVMTLKSWWTINSSGDAQQQLYKAQSFLERDLQSAAFETEPGRETLRIEKAPTELRHLMGSDGDVLWFLSAIEPTSGELVRRPSDADDPGFPFWQRNILYYAVTPSQPALLNFGYNATGYEIDGYEVGCPYKVLIRQEIDFGVTTDPSQVSSEENLMTFDDIIPHLQRPDGYNTKGMAWPNAAVRPVAGNLLTFRARLSQVTRGLEIDLRATGIEQARRAGAVGNRSLAKDPNTIQLKFSSFPPNRQGTETTDPD